MEIKDLANALQSLAMETGVDFVGRIHIESRCLRHVARSLLESLANCDRVFATAVLSKQNEIPAVAPFILSLRDYAEAGAAVRFACVTRSNVQTPYLPAAATISSSNSLSAAALYASDIKFSKGKGMPLKVRDVAGRLYTILGMIASSLGLNDIGVDMSLSPWGRDSVAEVIESLSGCAFGEPGTTKWIKTVTNAIRQSGSSVKLLGFNDVMLSYAEDWRLMELGSSGKLSLSQLMLYCTTCAVGLDMLPIPPSLEVRWIKNLLHDVVVLSDVKGEPLVIRLLPVNARPGEEVDVWLFKKVPVPRLRS